MKELLVKYINGNCTDQEKIVVVNWLDASPENMKEYLALRKLQDMAIWQSDPIPRNQETIIKKASGLNIKTISLELLKIAAVFVFAIIVYHYFIPGSATPQAPVVMQTVYVPAGQRARITLEDGTNVWLNAKTTFLFPNHFSGNIREVKLDGEGFFEVAHDQSKPFIVKTETYDVKVLGTTFNLMAYSGKDNFETSLLEGSVEVLKSGSAKGVLIKPDERIFLQNNQMVIAPIVQANHFLWKDGIISFDDESFPEIIAKLELYFDIKVVVNRDKPFNFRCTGKFRTKDGVEHILKVLQLSNKFNYTIDYKQNLITIEN